MADIPTLKTERLTLRAFEERDLDPLHELLSKPENVRYIGDGQPKDRPEVWRQIATILGHWELRGFGLWALEERSSGAFIGWCGLLEPEGWPGLEIGYGLLPAFRGHGYAREAAAEALRYAHVTLGRNEVISLIRSENAASIRVASSLGAQYSETIDIFGSPADIYCYPEGDND